MRASDRDRDAVVLRLQEAFADGRLDDEEFDQRTRAALTARLSTELALLTAGPAGRHWCAAASHDGAGRARTRPVRGRLQELDPPRRPLAGA